VKHLAVCVLLVLPAGAEAGELAFVIEPMHASIERSGAADVLGFPSAEAARIGCGVGVGRGPLQLALLFGRSATRTDFGLLDGPTSRVEHATTELEVRWATPLRLGPIGVQVAGGAGRLGVRHHPDRVHIVLAGSAYDVALPPEHAWTRHVAAELLHSLSGNKRAGNKRAGDQQAGSARENTAAGNTQLALRAAWRFYALDVATPAGVERRGLVDAQIGVALRARVF
jgi:hypothetical protein